MDLQCTIWQNETESQKKEEICKQYKISKYPKFSVNSRAVPGGVLESLR